MRSFDRFGGEHLVTLAGVLGLAILLVVVARRSPRAATISRSALAVLLAGGLAFALADSLPLRGLDWLDILPLHLCDMAVLIAVWALATRGRVACEMLYFWGLTGTLIAGITPDVDRGFPDARCVSFFALHGAVAVAAAVMTFGVGVRPRPGAHWRIFVITNAYAAMAAVIDAVAGKNYLYLRAKPSQPSMLDAMGPWPWYIVAADALALLLFWLLMLPFRRGDPPEINPGGPMPAHNSSKEPFMKTTRLLVLWTVPLLITLGSAFPRLGGAEEKAPSTSETRAEVAALDDYHDVIRTIWHDAWPNKDTNALRDLLPRVLEGAKAVAGATLPGILRDKQQAWGEGVATLETRVAAYAAAAEGTDDQELLDAAEQLHAQYEVLVRIIRPALRELDDVHVVLYQLYHYDLPSDDLDAMRKTIARFRDPMAALDAATIPRALENRKKEFASARKGLSQAVASLMKAAEGEDRQRVKDAIQEVHDRYEMTVAVCD